MDKKQHNKYPNSYEYRKNTLRFGEKGLKVINSHKITEDQFSKMSKNLKKALSSSSHVKWWCRVHINSTATKLSQESRMGKGKGSINHNYAYVKAGCVLYEFSDLTSYQSAVVRKLSSRIWKINLVEI